MIRGAALKLTTRAMTLPDLEYIHEGAGRGGLGKDVSCYSIISKITRRVYGNDQTSQYYPNPFNPSTVISYQLETNSIVVLKVLDVLGREVATLVNADQQAGAYNVTFDGSKLSSGIYFYRIDFHGDDGNNFISTEKMVLMK